MSIPETGEPVPVLMREITDLLAFGGWSWVNEYPKDNRLSDGAGTWFRLVHNMRSRQYFLQRIPDHRRAAAADHD